MLNDSSSNLHEIEPHKSLHIKHDNKFFTRLMSKETSFGNSPPMVYYGGSLSSIPFTWESYPGTPKHPSSDATLPPLTPPPSYHHSTFKSKPKPMPKRSLKSTLFGSIFRKLNTPRKNHASPSWSSSLHGSSMFHRRKGYFSCSRSPVHNCMDDDDDDDEGFGSSNSRLCFWVKVKPRNLNEFGGCQSMVNMKKALMSFVSHE